MKRLLIGIAALALSTAPPAGAKGPTHVRVCGESECVALEPAESASVITVAGLVQKPPAPGSYYRLDISVQPGPERLSLSSVFLPGEGLIASNARAPGALMWHVPRADALRLLHEATRELDPFPAPASWPANIEAPAGWTNYAPLVDEGLNWRPWALAVGALMIALSAGGLIARRRAATA